MTSGAVDRIGGALSAIERARDAVERAFVGGALAFVSLLCFANVFLRNVVLRPISWAEEVTLYAMVWIVFVGSSAVMRRGGHIAIDLLPQALPPRARVGLAVLVHLLAAAGLFAFAWFSYGHVERVRLAQQVTPLLQAPMWLAYLAMPVGATLTALTALGVALRFACGRVRFGDPSGFGE